MAAIILSLLAAALLSTVLLIPAGHLKQALGIPSAALAFLVIYVVASIMLNGSMVFYDAFLCGDGAVPADAHCLRRAWYRNSTGAAVPSLRCLRTGDPGRRGPGSDRMVLRKKRS